MRKYSLHYAVKLFVKCRQTIAQNIKCFSKLFGCFLPCFRLTFATFCFFAATCHPSATTFFCLYMRWLSTVGGRVAAETPKFKFLR